MIIVNRLANMAYVFIVLNIISIMSFSENANTIFIMYITYLLSGIFMVSAILLSGKKVFINKFHFNLLMWLFFCLASSLWTVNFSNSIASFLTIALSIIYAFVFYEFIITTRLSIDKFVIAIGTGAIVLGMYALYVYGINTFFNDLISGYRIGKEISQENSFSYYSAIGFLTWLFWGIQKKNKLFFALALFCFIMLLAGGSRGSFIASLLCVAIFLFKYNIGRGNRLKSIIRLISVLLGLFILVLIISPYILELDIVKRLELMANILSTSNDTDGSMMVRIGMIQFGFEKFLSSPLIGYGLDSYGTLYAEFTGWSTYSHNNFIDILVGLGGIGFFLFYINYIVLFCSKRKLIPVLFCILLFTLLDGFFKPYYQGKLIYILFAGLYYYLDEFEREKDIDEYNT